VEALCAGLLLVLIPGSVCASLYLSEDFSPKGEEQKYFFEGELGSSSYKYTTDGFYEINASRSSEPAHSVILQELSNYKIEAVGEIVEASDSKAQKTSATSPAWGVSFNYVETNGVEEFLLFLVEPRQKRFTLEKRKGKEAKSLIAPQNSNAINLKNNTLAVYANEGKIILAINGVIVGEASEQELVRGGFGLYVSPSTTARFDSFSVFTEEEATQAIVDDFENPPRKWFAGYQDGVNYKYESGAYQIDASESQKSGISIFPGSYASLELEVQAKKLSGPDNYGYGIFFQDIPNQKGGYDQFRFLISNDGWLTIQKSFDDIPRAIYDWTKREEVKQNDWNLLRVVVANSDVSFFVNGKLVFQLKGVPEMEGKLGLYASSGLKVAFDNFKLVKY